ncbi:MAG: hypothetical protein IJI57_04845 [Flexilinea sp.]|nr:hypothetical protein [Flexilinea sp.]
MEIDEKYKEIVEKIAEDADKFMLVCHTASDNNTMVYSRITYNSGLGLIGTMIDAFMQNTIPQLGRDKVIQDILSVVNYTIEQNQTQISEESQKTLGGLKEALEQGGKQ